MIAPWPDSSHSNINNTDTQNTLQKAGQDLIQTKGTANYKYSTYGKGKEKGGAPKLHFLHSFLTPSLTKQSNPCVFT